MVVNCFRSDLLTIGPLSAMKALKQLSIKFKFDSGMMWHMKHICPITTFTNVPALPLDEVIHVYLSKMKSYLASYIINKLQYMYFNCCTTYHWLYMHHPGRKVIHLSLIKVIIWRIESRVVIAMSNMKNVLYCNKEILMVWWLSNEKVSRLREVTVYVKKMTKHEQVWLSPLKLCLSTKRWHIFSHLQNIEGKFLSMQAC